MSSIEKKTLREKAEEKINAKLEILQRWSDNREIPWRVNDEGGPERDKNGELVLDYFPSNISVFHDWDGTQNCAYNQKTEIGTIHRFSRSTLARDYHAGLKSQVDGVIDSLNKIARRQVLEANKSTQIELITAERDELLALGNQHVREILQFRERMKETERKLRKTERDYFSNKTEMQRRITLLEQRNSELVATLNRLVPFQANKA